MKIAILSQDPALYSTRRLRGAGAADLFEIALSIDYKKVTE